MACKTVGTICLRVGEVKPYGIDLTSFLANRWVEGEIRSLGECVRPRERSAGGSGPNGFEYECTVAGQSGADEPEWPIVPGDTVTDGSCVWTCRGISNGSLAGTITSSLWKGMDGLVNFSGDATITTGGEQKTAVRVTGIAAGSGEIRNEVVISNSLGVVREETFALKVTVRANG